MKVLLVGNYLPDRQHSMQRFAALLRDGLLARGHEVELLTPPVKFGGGGNKWVGYADKFIAFPRVLRKAARWADVVHVCDHSNAMYVSHLGTKPNVVTCHDLLAVRGALGENTDCPASFTGRILQRWILRGLQRAQAVACVSSATQSDLVRLAGPGVAARSRVVMLGVAPTMRRLQPNEARQRIGGLLKHRNKPFLLNVGSNLKRKNRDGALRIFKKVCQKFDCDLVFAGESLSPDLKKLKSEIGLNGNVIEVPQPDDATLEALYSGAFALLYPTKFEGFGWPAIEAQSCGCPVVASTSTSIPEVIGDTGLLRAPEDEAGFAEDILKLTDAMLHEDFVARGYENVKRFTPERMVNDYIEIYQRLCAQNGN